MLFRDNMDVCTIRVRRDPLGLAVVIYWVSAGRIIRRPPFLVERPSISAAPD